MIAQSAGYSDDEANRFAPDVPEVVIAYAQSLKLPRGDTKRAIQVLRRVPLARIPHHGRAMLGMVLIERGTTSDHAEALEICVGLPNSKSQPDHLIANESGFSENT